MTGRLRCGNCSRASRSSAGRRSSKASNIIGAQEGHGEPVSLEPGGQFELSGAPLETIHETCKEISDHLRETRAIAEPMGVEFLALGFSPIWSLDETPMMPKGRYGIMKAYMERVGRLGRQMMFRSCTVQTNLDFGSEADMVKKMRVSLALQPIATALFANSPFAERPHQRLSVLSLACVDRHGSGSHGHAAVCFRGGLRLRAVCRLRARRADVFRAARGQVYRLLGAFVSRLHGGQACRRCRARSRRWTISTTTSRRSSRRCASRPSSRCAARMRARRRGCVRCRRSGSGFSTTSVALDGAWELVKGWTAGEREAMRRTVPAHGPPARRSATPTAQAVAKDVLKLVPAGLKRRRKLSAAARTRPFSCANWRRSQTAAQSMAERLLAKYHGEWKRDLSRAFAEVRF